jgi:YidC/Oxa1 family membrane protein insertase
MNVNSSYLDRGLKELSALGMFLFNTDKNLAEIVFYSSQAQYISYYDGLLDELVEHQKKSIVYLTSDIKDGLLGQKRAGIISHYSKSFLPFIFPAIDSSVLITTIPDLHQYKIRRSFAGTNYIYTFHSLVSTHMMYRKGAFDFYDTVFCAGPHHAAEIRRTEQVYGLPPKTIHEVGYYRLEKIYNEHHEYLSNYKNDAGQKRKLALIAPGWQESNILDTCAEELIDSLLAEEFDVVMRPHPMTIEKTPELIGRLQEKYSALRHFAVDLETTSERYLHAADVMICDWSGVALEYALGTERPVLFIDLPRKVHNSEYEKLSIIPLEVRIREQIGRTISASQAGSAGRLALDFILRQQEYHEQILAARQKNIYHFGESPRVGAEIILDILNREVKGRLRA